MPATQRYRRQLVSRGLVCVLGAALILISACSERSDASATGLQPGEPTPDVEFRTLTGDRLSLRDMAGPVLVNFWATDCAICVEEMPELSALWERLQPEGYTFVAVAMPHDRPDAVVQMVEARAWKHPVAIDIEGVALAALGNVVGTPTSFLITPDGTLDERIVGRVDVDELEARLRELL